MILDLRKPTRTHGGLDRPTSGEVFVDGNDLTTLSPNAVTDVPTDGQPDRVARPVDRRRGTAVCW